MSEIIIVSGTLSFGLQYRATRDIARRGYGYLMTVVTFAAVPVLALLSLLALGGNGLTESTSIGVPMWSILLAGPVFIFVLVPLLNAQNIARLRRQNPAAYGVRTFLIGPETYEVQGSNFDSRLQWSGIRRAVETKEFFLFYVSQRSAHFVPKAFVKSPEELQAIRRTVREALGAKARLRAT